MTQFFIGMTAVFIFLTDFAIAGGLDISGNGKSIQNIQDAIKSNQSRLVEISKANCPGNTKKMRFDNMTRINVVFNDNEIQSIIPLKFEKIGNLSPGNKQKYNVVFLNDLKDKVLSFERREVVIDETWKHENKLGIVWHSQADIYKVNKFEKFDLDMLDQRDVCDVHKVIPNNELQNIISSVSSSSSDTTVGRPASLPVYRAPVSR